MIGGTTPTFQIMRGVAGGRGLHKYIYKGFLNFGKNFLKKFWKV